MSKRDRTTIGISRDLYNRMDERRANGQSFEGFIEELLEKTGEEQ